MLHFTMTTSGLFFRSYASNKECKSRAASLTTATYYPLNACNGYSMYTSCTGMLQRAKPTFLLWPCFLIHLLISLESFGHDHLLQAPAITLQGTGATATAMTMTMTITSTPQTLPVRDTATASPSPQTPTAPPTKTRTQAYSTTRPPTAAHRPLPPRHSISTISTLG